MVIDDTFITFERESLALSLAQADAQRGVTLASFAILRVIGIGSFGKVYLVKQTPGGHIAAMKVISKHKLVESAYNAQYMQR
jgi:serine/threonine protein kinase